MDIVDNFINKLLKIIVENYLRLLPACYSYKIFNIEGGFLQCGEYKGELSNIIVIKK